MISSQIPMRRYENQIHDPEMIGAMLDMFDTVYVGSIDEIYPYVVPLSFGYEVKEGKLYRKKSEKDKKRVLPPAYSIDGILRRFDGYRQLNLKRAAAPRIFSSLSE